MRTFLLAHIAVLEFLICFSATATAQNVVPNPDFDSGSIGWSGGTLFETDGSPSAPSYLVASPAYNQQAAYSDCFALDHTKQYAFTARGRVISGDLGIIQVVVYQDSACTTLAGGGYIFLGNFAGGNWMSVSSEPAFFPYSNVMSGKIELVANTGYNYAANVLFDHIVLEPEEIFSDDFESH